MNPTTYIKSLTLKNIKTFGEGGENGEGVTLNLSQKDGTIPQWTLILGDNSIGKSTLLHCIAWMKPNVIASHNTKGGDPEPTITDEQNETLEQLVKTSSNLTGFVKATFVANQPLNELPTSQMDSYCESSISIGVNNSNKLERIEPKFDGNKKGKKIFTEVEIPIFAYSASRHLGELNLSSDDLLDTIPDFIKDKTELYDVEEILLGLDYARLGSKGNKERYEGFITQIKEMLVKIIPDIEKVKDIEISPPKLLSKDKTGRGGLIITTKHGKRIPYSNYSLGYKTVIAWAVDLAWRLFNRNHEDPDKPNGIYSNSLDMPAIVLIDEIDMHLHPKWQREIMNTISDCFHYVQFIATAHSPLMVQASINSNHAVLSFDKDDDSVKIINDPKGIDGWRIDQILTSEFFGLKSSRGVKYEEQLERREELLNKKRLTKAEKNELTMISNEISNLPTGETPEEIENRRLISEVVENIRKNNTVIEL